MNSKANEPLRVGIVGAGFMGEVHARAVIRSGARLAAVAAGSPAEARDAATRWGAEGFASDPEAVLTADDLDVVHICTPNHLHAGQAQVALESGQNVICEKPLATSSADARRLADLARESGTVTAVPFVYRFYGSVRETRARIQRGDAGTLRLVHGSYLQDWLADPADTNWRVNPRLGGASRAFGDIGIHWCDLAEFVTGQRITRLVATTAAPVDRTSDGHPKANGTNPDDQTATEDIASLLFQMDGGITGSVLVSQVSLGRKNRLWLSVDGEEAAYSFDQENPETLWVGGRTHNMIVPRGSSEYTPDAAAYNRTPAGHPQGYQDCFDAFIRDVQSAVRGELPDGLPSFGDGLRSALIVDAVLASSRTGQWVEVGDETRIPDSLLAG